MARTPRATYSAAKLIVLSERACHLCGQAGNGAQKYSALLMQARNALEQWRKTASAKELERVVAYDAAIQANRTLDDAVRSAFDACRMYERNNNYIPVVEKAFPGGVFTPVVRAPRINQPDLVREVIACLRQIDPEHSELCAIASDLETALTFVVRVRESLGQKTRDAGEAQALEKLGKKEFVEAYNAIYHQACADLGRKRADILFPVIRSGRKQETHDRKQEEEPLRTAA
jgi:hypothetical protein